MKPSILQSFYYASHCRPLTEIFARAIAGDARLLADNVSVVEFGAGIHSTPLLFGLCALTNANFSSFEDDKEWARSVRALTGTSVSVVDDLAKPGEFLRNVKIDIGFVDGSADSRLPCVEYCKENGATIIVLHDSDEYDDHFYNCRDAMKSGVRAFCELKPSQIEAERLMPATSFCVPNNQATKDIPRDKLADLCSDIFTSLIAVGFSGAYSVG